MQGVLQLNRQPGALGLHIPVIELHSQLYLLCSVCFANQALLCITLRIFWALGLSFVPKQRLPVPLGTPPLVTSSDQTPGAVQHQEFPSACMPNISIEAAPIATAPHKHLCSSSATSKLLLTKILFLFFKKVIFIFYFQLQKLWPQPLLLQNWTLPCLTDWFRERVRSYFSIWRRCSSSPHK